MRRRSAVGDLRHRLRLTGQAGAQAVAGADLAEAVGGAVAVARRIRTGTLAVNGGVWFSPDAPFGGYKQSGVGREMGVAGFEEYLETKTIAEPA